ncbi:DUF6911 family protein [Pseudomonas sp. NY15437]|uniref:DUF6911 family protein n=1 Tax=Pseudomonas sp. NY15437 TaxID=3400360 RepID=UPI003A892F2A
MSDCEKVSGANLELCWGDNLSTSLAITVEQPVWESIERGIFESFNSGGFVRLRVLSPKTSFVSQLSMKSWRGMFRVEVLTRSSNPKDEYLEWWEAGNTSFRGTVRFGDEEFDSRMICTDISVANDIFKELYEKGDLEMGLAQMRSPWNPKP